MLRKSVLLVAVVLVLSLLGIGAPAQEGAPETPTATSEMQRLGVTNVVMVSDPKCLQV